MKQHVEVVYFPEGQGDYGELWRVGTRVLTLLEAVSLGDGAMVRGVSRRCMVNDGLMHMHAVYRLRLKPEEASALMGEMEHRQKFENSGKE